MTSAITHMQISYIAAYPSWEMFIFILNWIDDVSIVFAGTNIQLAVRGVSKRDMRFENSSMPASQHPQQFIQVNCRCVHHFLAACPPTPLKISLRLIPRPYSKFIICMLLSVWSMFFQRIWIWRERERESMTLLIIACHSRITHRHWLDIEKNQQTDSSLNP